MIVRFENKEYAVSEKGSTFAGFLKGLEKLDSGVVAVMVDGKAYDLGSPIREGELTPVYVDSPEGMEILRHSTAHVMAQAVKELFPEAKVTIGPAIETGFYYDFDYEPGFTEEDLPRIEARMREIVKRDLPIVRRVVSKAEALELFHGFGEPFKEELISGIEDDRGKHLYAGRLHGLLPGTAPLFDGEDKGVQAPKPGGRVLAGRREEQDADQDLRDGLRQRRRPGGAPGVHRRSQEEGPQAPRQRARPFQHLRRGRRRSRHIPPERRPAPLPSGRLREEGAPEAGL